jgi:radical SAM superfamily enzyme YgiQ (UPF0313 family)
MRLTIIHPCIGRIPGKAYIKSWEMEPLPPAYIAALTPDDVEVAFWDDRVEDIPYDDATDLVAISIETYTAKRAYQIATEYRRRGVPVVMGGFHATLVTQEVLKYADAVVVGEAEQSFPRLLADFRAGRMQRLYRSKGRPSLSLIRPDRRIFEGKRYLNLGLVEASRGCNFKCEFCAVTAYFKATQSRRPIELLIAEIAAMKASKDLFFFVDDNIVSNKAFAKAFYRALIPLNIRWVSQATITMTYDDELMALMKASGCQGVLIGFESLNADNLRDMNKSFNAARGGFAPALAQLHKYGMRLYATFVFGYEHDSIDAFDRSVDFCIEHDIFMAAFNHLTPFPGTPLYTKLEQQGRLLYDQWWLDDRYRYGHVPFRTHIPPEVISERCIEARKRFYSISSTWKRMFCPTNAGSLFMLKTYWFINLLLRKEASQRENYPLGDLRFEGELMPVAEHEKVAEVLV